MAFDSRITVGIRAEGTRDTKGRYVPGPITNYPVWADERNAGSSDQEAPQGIIVREIRTFLIRWFLALSVAPISRVSVSKLEADGTTVSTWNALNKAESNERRRYITIEAIRTNP